MIEKNVDRPLCVPIPDSISILLVLPPSLLGILLLLSVSSWMTYACIICVFALCCCMVFLQRIFKERGWCQFEEPTSLLALSDSAHVLDYESSYGSTVEDSNDTIEHQGNFCKLIFKYITRTHTRTQYGIQSIVIAIS